MFHRKLKSLIVLVYAIFTTLTLSSALEFTNVRLRHIDYQVMEKVEMFVLEYQGRNRINGTWIFGTELEQLDLRVFIDLQSKTNRTQRFLNLDIDACKFLAGQYLYKNKLVGLVRKSLMMSPTWQRKCPIPAHVEWKFEYYDFDTDVIPTYLPNMTFVADFTAFYRGKRIYNVALEGCTHSVLRSSTKTKTESA